MTVARALDLAQQSSQRTAGLYLPDAASREADCAEQYAETAVTLAGRTPAGSRERADAELALVCAGLARSYANERARRVRRGGFRRV